MSCPKWAAFSHAWYCSKGKEATYHNDILVASIHSCKQQPIYCIVCIRVCLIPYIWFLIRILDFGNCNPYGAAKGGERFAKDLRKGGSWELLFSTTPIYRFHEFCSWFFFWEFLQPTWAADLAWQIPKMPWDYKLEDERLEPTNHSFRKENDLNQTSMRKCSMLIFRGVTIIDYDSIRHQGLEFRVTHLVVDRTIRRFDLKSQNISQQMFDA